MQRRRAFAKNQLLHLRFVAFERDRIIHLHNGILSASRARAKLCLSLLRGCTISTMILTDCLLDYEKGLELIDLPRKLQRL